MTIPYQLINFLFIAGIIIAIMICGETLFQKLRQSSKTLSKHVERFWHNTAAWWKSSYTLLLFVIFFGLGIFLAISIFPQIIQAINSTLAHFGDNPSFEGIRNNALALIAFVGGIAAIIGLFLTPIRAWINERNTKATENGLITDRINKAVENLAAVTSRKIRNQDGEEEILEPNIPVRIGAVLALEKLMMENARYYENIGNLLVEYIRHEARLPENVFSFSINLSAQGEDKYKKLNKQIEELPPTRRDIERALRSLSRAKEHYDQYPSIPAPDFNLTECNFKKAQLSGLYLKGMNFERSVFYLAQMSQTDLQKADLREAILQRANLSQANLQGANLSQANLQGADLRHAKLQDADLAQANLLGAHSSNALLQGAKLHDANLQEADLRNAKGLTQKQISLSLGNPQTRLDKDLWVITGLTQVHSQSLPSGESGKLTFTLRSKNPFKPAYKTGSNFPDEDILVTDEELGLSPKAQERD